MTLAIIDWDALLTVIWASLLGGIGVTAAYGFAILGGTRAIDLGREGRVAEAAVYAVIGLFGMATVVAAIVFGIVVLSDK
ncbi:MAG: hypothetical protein QOH58_1014 [Thermoleophilaceae bacterium]|jgi:hypothetical protein|nr:hypothetical protein [Thermoleophilaceae bacterium]